MSRKRGRVLRSTRSLSRQSTATLKLKKGKIEIENGNENRIHMANKKQNMHTNKKKKGEHDREVKKRNNYFVIEYDW